MATNHATVTPVSITDSKAQSASGTPAETRRAVALVGQELLRAFVKQSGAERQEKDRLLKEFAERQQDNQTSAPLADTPPKPQTQSYRVQRDGEIDLAFVGVLIGSGDVESGRRDSGVRERRVSVRIYVTTGGKFVGHVHRRWNFDEEYRDAAWACETGKHLLVFLRNTNNDTLGQASRDAWNMACRQNAALAPFEVETID